MRVSEFRRVAMAAVAALLLVLLPLGPLGRGAVAQEYSKTVRKIFTSASRGSTTGAAIDVGDASGLVAYLDVTANTGTNPTLDVKIQDSVDGASPWFDLAGASFTQVTGSTSSQIVTATRAPARFIRAVATVGGSSTPKFTFTLSVVVHKAPAVSVTTTLGGALSGTSLTVTGASGESGAIKSITEEITLSTGGATTDSSSNLLPANSLILGVGFRITTAIAGADSTAVQIGDSAVAARFGSMAALTAGTSGVGITHWNGNISATNAGPTQASAAALRVTLSGGGDNTPSAGKVRVTVFYLPTVAPTN